ncbi:hypothetical protein JQ633_12530 [Bradyrhizobium tropiciagri]|uniref:hypothetical protein n=1 Tax=Bradyrhizobium tropiciagri TaxID=312253 RepID=UPI001BA59776|nr:hypothetical protein [Bradyrhizobium tropiciagri]MBR0871189.1 hypothetical protein [Bradyrhizobium tropiciagri]
MEGWHFHVHASHAGGDFIAMAKKEPFVNGDPLREPGDVWFEFGASPDEAMAKLKRSLLN